MFHVKGLIVCFSPPKCFLEFHVFLCCAARAGSEINNTESREVVLASNTAALAGKEKPDQIHLKTQDQFNGVLLCLV